MNDIRTYELEYDRCRASVRHNVDTNDAELIFETGEKFRSVVSRAPEAPNYLEAWRMAGRWEPVT